ncbi:MAG: GNAT family N-acetyltransferase, partial [Methylocystis sp.]
MTFDLALRAAPLAAFAPAGFVIDDESPDDVFAREKLLDACFGPARFLKTCEKLRAGRAPARGLALAAHD